MIDIYFRADSESDLAAALPECVLSEGPQWINNLTVVKSIITSPEVVEVVDGSVHVVTPAVVDSRCYGLYRLATSAEALIFEGRPVTLGALNVSTGEVLYGDPPSTFPVRFM